MYTDALKSKVRTPMFDKKYISSWAQYCIQLKNEEERDELQNFLKQKSIPTMVYYPKPMHLQKAFDNMEFNEEEFEVSTRLCKTVLELPIHPYMDKTEVEYIIKQILLFLDN